MQDPGGQVQHEVGDLARIQVTTGLSVVIPTYREVENIPHILARLNWLRQVYDLDIEVLFMDDSSNDGSLEAVQASGFGWARMVVRTGPRGLSYAVVDGFKRAKHPVIVCMDCDLSHPVKAIPTMVLALSAGQQFVIGSRYVSGGSTDDDWGILRYLNSLIATTLARPLTRVRDPMSGFFAMRKSSFDKALKDLNPVGYKIALELIVKCGFDNVAEVPIHFADRRFGQSKLNFIEQLKYIKHLRRLFMHKFANAMHLLQFLVVGFSGLLVNLSVLSVLLFFGLPDAVCLAAGIGVSVVTNFLLNRRFTFSYAKDGNIWRQFAGFASVSSVGIFVNYSVALIVNETVASDMRLGLQLSAVIGVIAGMGFNYLGNRYVVFRETYFRSKR